MKEKIGLVIAHGNTNYGAMLQGYATQQVIEDMGYETEIIEYKARKYRRGLKFFWGLIPFFWNKYKESREKKKLSVSDDMDAFHLQNKKERKLRMAEFEKSRLNNIKQYHGYEALKDASKSCKAVLIGSDQMWLPGVSFGNFQSLRFVDKGVHRVSYATSLGVSEYPSYCYGSARDMWKRFDSLSVREEQGKKIVQSVCHGLPVKVVCDPTYLLTKEQWELKIPSKKMTDEKYVLCYFLGNSEKQMQMAAEYAKTKGLKCYSILSDESMNSIDATFADKTIVGASVEDFVNWIRGAECVITDSFHGLAFSVINEKQLYIFYRQRLDAKASRNSRIDNILKMWQIENRFVPTDATSITESKAIDYGNVNKMVADKRRESMEFLSEALNFRK